MHIERGALPKFAKLCFYSGTFTVLSLACFSMVYYFTTPEVERFVNSLKMNALWNWVQHNFLDLSSLGLSLLFLITTVVASFIGFMSAIFAKVMHDRAQDVLKAGIRD